MSGRGGARLGLAMAVALLGCKPEVGGELPICAAEVAGGQAAEVEHQQLPAELWYAILLDGFDRERMFAGDDPRDCTGTPSAIPTPLPAPPNEAGVGAGVGADVEACPPVVTEEPLPSRPLTDDDLVVAPGPDGTTLVWVHASHYADGEASGPVAIVEWTRAGVAVRALGSLRAPTRAADLRVELAGGQRFVVVGGEVCPPLEPEADDRARVCVRVVRLLPIVAGRIATVGVRASADADAPCLGPAAFVLGEAHTAELGSGRVREFEIVRSVRFDRDGIRIAEQVAIADRDPNEPEAPPQPFRAAARERALVFDGQWFATEPSLWAAMIDSYGAVD